MVLELYVETSTYGTSQMVKKAQRISILLHRTEEPVIPPLAAVTAFIPSPDVQVLDMPVDPNEPTYCLCHQVRSVNLRGMLECGMSMLFSEIECIAEVILPNKSSAQSII